MKYSVIFRRLVGLAIPKKIKRKLQLTAPDRGGDNKLERENNLLNLVGVSTEQNLRFLDFGCGRMRIGRTGRVKAYYVDTSLSSYVESDCDIRGLNALASLVDAGVDFDTIISNSAIQYLFPEDVSKFFCYSNNLLKSSGMRLLFLEIDQRDLMDGVNKISGVAYYKNEFRLALTQINDSKIIPSFLKVLLLKILQSANIYTNSLRFSDYLSMFEKYFILVKAEQNLDGLSTSWVECEAVSNNVLLFRLWLQKR